MATLDYAGRSASDAVAELKSSLESGLSSSDAEARLELHGENELRATGTTWWKIFGNQFKTPFVYLLIAAALISFAAGDGLDASIIILYVSVNALLGFYQEYRSEQALRALRQYLVLRAHVRRDGAEQTIEAQLLVPGDIVILSTGDVVPADLRILECSGFSIDESVLTGESVSVHKDPETVNAKPQEMNVYAASNLAFAGTTVVSGKGFGLVVSTGAATSIGTIASLTVGTEEASAFSKGIRSFSQFILRIIILTIVLVFAANILIKGAHANIPELLIFSIALAVSVIPEALPVVTTLSLSRGALRLAKRKVVVKRLSAIEDLGSIEMLCTDKTGTLTENALTVSKIYGESAEVLAYANRASSEEHEKSREPFDVALWRALSDERIEFAPAKVLRDVPFDPKRRRNTVIVSTEKGTELVTRGALEEVAALCADMSDAKREELSKWAQERGNLGERVIAVAHKTLQGEKISAADHAFSGLAFSGLVSFVDPIKESAAGAILKAKQLGIKVKIITGDSPEVAGAVAQSVGLVESSGETITGAEFSALSSEAQHDAVLRYSVFARVSPEEKFAVLRTLQEKYEVGFLGEGINDAPALKAAGVGIVVQGASGVAQEAADILLLEKDLEVIVDGIKEGRVVFANTLKYLKATLASNFGNFYAIAIGSLFIDFLPMLPIQILLVNLLSDFPMIAIATDSVDPSEVARPEKYRVQDVIVLATILGVVSTVFDFIFFAIYYRISPQSLQTNWFIESILTELLFLFSIRTRSFFLKGKAPSTILVWLSILAFCMTIILPFLPFGQAAFHLLEPNVWQLETTLGLVAIYFAATETTKLIYYRYVDGMIMRKSV
jgi:Mg2+-importing ATPase